MPSKLPRIVVRLSPELDQRVAAYAERKWFTYAHAVEQLLMADEPDEPSKPAASFERERLVRARVASHRAQRRPITRAVRVHPLVKHMIAYGADGRASRSAWCSATIELALDHIEALAAPASA